MSDDDLLEHRDRASAGKQPLVVRHTDQDLQLEVLEKLAELQRSSESWRTELATLKEQSKPSKFDTRSLIALGAIALSIAGYVLQDARNTSRQDTEIEATKARVTNLERIAATNTEARVRSEVELRELRQGQEEIKQMLVRHDSRVGRLPPEK